jgi:hypothetical protein
MRLRSSLISRSLVIAVEWRIGKQVEIGGPNVMEKPWQSEFHRPHRTPGFGVAVQDQDSSAGLAKQVGSRQRVDSGSDEYHVGPPHSSRTQAVTVHL